MKINTEKKDKPLIVMDTNVLVSGLCRYENSPTYKILRGVHNREIPIALNQKLFLEYESVLYRKEILQLTGATTKETKLILDALLALALESESYYLWRPNLKDESDNFVLEVAVTTSAFLITKNIKDFKSGELIFPELVLMSPEKFCKQYLKE
jgi:putative PIN family toxin of toxin-antitoxin system